MTIGRTPNTSQSDAINMDGALQSSECLTQCGEGLPTQTELGHLRIATSSFLRSI